jgi:hypothetical protein
MPNIVAMPATILSITFVLLGLLVFGVAIRKVLLHHYHQKKPAEWAQMLDGEILVTALLDRLLFKCQVISLNGKS